MLFVNDPQITQIEGGVNFDPTFIDPQFSMGFVYPHFSMGFLTHIFEKNDSNF